MMDLTAVAPRVPNMGETVIGSAFYTAPGGKGANQAVQCARLGAEVSMAGCVGEDSFGREMLEAVRAAGVDVSHVKISKKTFSGVGNIQLERTPQGTQNRILVVPGANYDLVPEDLDWLTEEVKNFDLVMLQLELSPEVTRFVAQQAHNANVPVMLNPAPAAKLSAELLNCITYLSPNEHEAALLTDICIRTDENGANSDDVLLCANKLGEKGVEKVIITLGVNGAVLADREGLHHTSCIKMEKVCDPTAAGDSFVAAFCTGITAGMSESDAMTLASHTAAVSVSRAGAMPSLPTIDDVAMLMQERNCLLYRSEIIRKLKEGEWKDAE